MDFQSLLRVIVSGSAHSWRYPVGPFPCRARGSPQEEFCNNLASEREFGGRCVEVPHVKGAVYRCRHWAHGRQPYISDGSRAIL